MRLTHLSRYKTETEMLKEYVDEFKAIGAHLKQKTKPGIPYNVLTIYHELNINGLFDNSGRAKCILCLVIDQLSKKHSWRLTKMPIYFAIEAPAAAISLYDIVDSMLPSNTNSTVAELAEAISYLYGEEVKEDSVRKAVFKLRKDGRFTKLKSGFYQRTHIGY